MRFTSALEQHILIYTREEAGHASKLACPTVRFADDASSEPTAQASANEDNTAIQDLCQAIMPAWPLRPADDATSTKIGYLESETRSRVLFNLDPEDQMSLQNYNIESLEAFMQATPRRDARLKIGCDLAFAILSLGTSTWIPTTWTAKDLFLVKDPAVSLPKPYFKHPWLRELLSSNEPRSPATQTRASLFALGVLLLELTFRDQLENQSFRASKMGADMKPTAASDLATALLWQQKVEEELGHDLADAIKRCLVCMFDQAVTPDLGNSRFVQAVWQQVVRPIESFIRAWNRN